jgi:DNA-binding CsgD family transcriptional regulator
VKADAISLVEAAYDLEAPERAWMTSLVEHAIPLLSGASRGVAYTLDASNDAAPKFGMPASVGFGATFERELLELLTIGGALLTMHMLSKRVATLTEIFDTRDIREIPNGGGKFVLVNGSPETFGCMAIDAARRGLVLSTDLIRVTQLSRAVRSRWELIGAHIAAGRRARASTKFAPNDDCILSPGGRILHAESDATLPRARERLRDAVIARDRARTRAVRADPEKALGLSPGLVSGRWSLVDRFERDGRRYVVARRNEPLPPGPLALSLRERQVLGHMVQGDSVKLTAYALGLAPSTVSEIGAAVRLKLGARNPCELTALVAGAPREPNGGVASVSRAQSSQSSRRAP